MQTSLFGSSAAAGQPDIPPGVGLEASKTSDMFTRLLVAQIRNQDPLSPSDPGQFVSQLTQLSQTEAMQKLASLGSASATALQSLQVLALGAQVGSELMVSTASVTLDGTAPVGGRVHLGAGTSRATLVLTGADGVQHNVELGPRNAGDVAFSIDPGALGLAPGTYTMSVASASGEHDIPIDIAARLSSVHVGAGGAIVLTVTHVGDIAPAAVTAFNGKPASRI